uniref:DUF4435 domain-containing protein n=1 Tax=Candidatus Kentrum sp. FM TaxID=2126340 RepID=A0A450TEQ0_9GAMM|nr:MAG: hypothetical protein BECKFM1743A_GA0114220_103863 [Candidatus Kentron sp. FM]VFJ70318.1 MAG: hypothetical protein BECKFM1743C_GA0114222_105523 [Candidatus Kentron sp. FM]VFK18438.1 MAG: hypothetical protein BECKFM1743B_GA0114221_105462 [Candidatus Kentron sp. FM]
MKQKEKFIKSHRLLLVEGKDESNFFDGMLKYMKVEGVQLVDIGGKDKFKTKFPFFCKSDGFSEVRALGFIRDAETKKADSAFSSICAILEKYDLPVPKAISTISNENGRGIKTGIFIMPNNRDAGMLEDLCLESIKTDPVLECVNRYMECCLSSLPENEREFNESKARVQTYLASKRDIASSLGLAAQKGYWDFENGCFHEIERFLNELFTSPKGV